MALATTLCIILKSSVIKREPRERKTNERDSYDSDLQAFDSNDHELRWRVGV